MPPGLTVQQMGRRVLHVRRTHTEMTLVSAFATRTGMEILNVQCIVGNVILNVHGAVVLQIQIAHYALNTLKWIVIIDVSVKVTMWETTVVCTQDYAILSVMVVMVQQHGTAIAASTALSANTH